MVRVHRAPGGSALLEFALALPLLLMLITGLVLFALLFHSWLSISNGAREGARAGVVGRSNNEIEEIVREKTPTLIQESLHVAIEPAREIDRAAGDPLRVEVRYDFPVRTPIYSLILPNPMPLSAATSMRIESPSS